MSTDRQHGKPILICDDCGEDYEGRSDDDACPAFWDAFIEGAKANGWRIYHDGDEWRHRCPGCL